MPMDDLWFCVNSVHLQVYMDDYSNNERNEYYLMKILSVPIWSWLSEKNNPLHIKFYLHQLTNFFIQLCISLLSYIKII